MKKVWLALGLAIFPCIFPWFFHKSSYPSDFAVYYTAATLVREHQGSAIYGGVNEERAKQLRIAAPIAAPDTVFSQTGLGLGFSNVMLYLYPPILADTLVPFSFLGPHGASTLWTVINLLSLGVIAVLIAKLLKLNSILFGSIALFLVMVCTRPVISCFFSGQVLVLLFLMWTAGIYLYLEGKNAPSAFLFALATSIKLTPLIVVLPFLIWREWKWLRLYALSLALIVLCMYLVNGPGVLEDYFRNVVPAMSGGIASNRNESIGSSIQLLFLAAHGRVPDAGTATLKLLPVLGKVCSLLLVVAALIPVGRIGVRMGKLDRLMTLTLFAALSAVVAPISWSHAYTVALLAFVLLWAAALRHGISNARLAWLTLCTFAVSTYVVTGAIKIVSDKLHHGALANLLTIIVPGSVAVLVLARLFEMRPDGFQEDAPQAAVA
jgi:hypothetical protein